MSGNLPDGVTQAMLDAYHDGPEPPEPEFEPEPCCECGQVTPCKELARGESADCLCYRRVYEPDTKLCPECRKRETTPPEAK